MAMDERTRLALPPLGAVGRSPVMAPTILNPRHTGGDILATVYGITVNLGTETTRQVRYYDLFVLGAQIAAAPRMRALLAALVAEAEQAPGSLDAISDILEEARAVLAFAGKIGPPPPRAPGDNA